jgi:hypothetical protein
MLQCSGSQSLRFQRFVIVAMLAVLTPSVGADGKPDVERDLRKVAAVQISGYDKSDLPREGFEPTEQLIPDINRAGMEKALLIVFPEYVLGRITVPGPLA